MALLRLLHAWAGAILALLMIVEGLTGAALALKPDYLRLKYPEARAEAAVTPQALGAAADTIEKAHPGHIQRLVFASPGLGVHQAFFMHDGYGYAAQDGRMLDMWSGPARPETFLYELHHFLLLDDIGMKIVGYGALAAAVVALVGLIVWLPVWKAFRPIPWPRSGQRRELIAAHRNLGIVFVLPVMLFLITGASIIFYETSRSLLMKWAPGPVHEEFFPPADPGDIDWPKALTLAQAKFPKAQLRMIFWPEGVWAPAIVRLRQPGELPPDGETEVLIDPSTSNVLGVKDATPLGKGLRTYAAILPIHTAQVGGRGFDVLTVLTGLALAAMGGFGLWAFTIKQLRRARSVG
jgi:uncharacterized iron-regulated membrane protein